MDNIKIIKVECLTGLEEHILIDRGNGEFTSMPKVVWDELKAIKETGTIS